MVKTFKNLLQKGTVDDLETWYAELDTKYYQNPTNDYSRFTFDLFFRKVKFTPLCIYTGKSLNRRLFSEHIKDSGITLDMILELNKYRKLYECQMSRSYF